MADDATQLLSEPECQDQNQKCSEQSNGNRCCNLPRTTANDQHCEKWQIGSHRQVFKNQNRDNDGCFWIFLPTELIHELCDYAGGGVVCHATQKDRCQWGPTHPQTRQEARWKIQ